MRGPADLAADRAFRLALFALVALFLAVRHGYPILAWANQIHDDALFFRAVGTLLHGEWLGPYDNLTLTKGPLMSIVGAVAVAFDVWIKTLEAFLYVAMALLFAAVAPRIGLGRVWILLAVLLLFCNPHLWSSAGSRLLRDILYSGLAVALVLILVPLVSRPRPLWRQAALGVAVGLCAGLMLITREEDVWMAPSVAVILACAALSVLWPWQRGRVWRAAAVGGIAVGGAAVGAGLAVGPVLVFNQQVYGRAIVSEFRAPEFRAAIGALMRVGDRHPSPYVSVPETALAAVFAVSPAAATLQPVWERVRSGWSHVSRSVRPEGSRDVAGGWFVWAFREAAANAGHHGSAQTARQFYGQVAQQVNAACDSGALRCRARRDTLAPEVGWRHAPALLRAGLRSLLHTARLGSDAIIIQRGIGDEAQLALWDEVVGAVISEPRRIFVLSGWLLHGRSDPTLTLPAYGMAVIRNMRVWAAPDVVAESAARGESVRALRFAVTVECPALPCSLLLTTDGDGQYILSVPGLAAGALNLPAPWAGFLEHVRTEQQLNEHSLGPALQAPYRLAAVKSAVALAQWLTPALALTATIGVAMFILSWRRRMDLWWLAALAVGAAAAVANRAAIVGYIDVTSWRAVEVTYLGPAYPFMIIYAVVGSALLLKLIGPASPQRQSS
jgi:hypothetical protein